MYLLKLVLLREGTFKQKKGLPEIKLVSKLMVAFPLEYFGTFKTHGNSIFPLLIFMCGSYLGMLVWEAGLMVLQIIKLENV